jgi:SAM-dependent methyltransferase
MRQAIEDFIYKKVIRNILLMSKLGRQSVLGEASTGYNFDHIYRNKADGYLGVGQIIDYILLHLPAVKATRARKENIITMLTSEIEQRKKKEKVTRIIDVACGAGRYLAELDAEFNESGIEIIGVDYDTKSLTLGKSIAESYGVSEKSIRFFKGNIFRLNHLKRLGAKIDWRPHIIIASGLVEYLDDNVVQDVFGQIREALGDEGCFLFVSQQNNPSRKLMEKVGTTKDGPWVLHYRDPLVLYNWLTEVGFKDIHVKTDQWRMYDLFTVRK